MANDNSVKIEKFPLKNKKSVSKSFDFEKFVLFLSRPYNCPDKVIALRFQLDQLFYTYKLHILGIYKLNLLKLAFNGVN